MLQFSLLRTENIPSLLGAAITAFAGHLVLLAIYNCYFHALKDIPGPFWASITPLWYAYALDQSQSEKYQRAAHNKYGSFHSETEAWIRAVFGSCCHGSHLWPKSDFYKSEFYDAFNAHIAPLSDNFCDRDEKVHSARRKKVAHLYSQAGALEFDPCIDKVIKVFFDKMQEKAP